MTTRAEDIAAELYYTQPWEKEEDRQLFSELNAIAEREQAAFVNGYKQGQQDRWIPVSQFKAPAHGTIILFGSKATVRMWTWDANNDEPPSSWATHFQLIELPPNPEQR